MTQRLDYHGPIDAPLLRYLQQNGHYPRGDAAHGWLVDADSAAADAAIAAYDPLQHARQEAEQLLLSDQQAALGAVIAPAELQLALLDYVLLSARRAAGDTLTAAQTGRLAQIQTLAATLWPIRAAALDAAAQARAADTPEAAQAAAQVDWPSA